MSPETLIFYLRQVRITLWGCAVVGWASYLAFKLIMWAGEVTCHT